MNRQDAVIATPLGPLRLVEEDGELLAVAFAGGEPLRPPATPLLKQAAAELEGYFRGERTRFTLPLRHPPGATPFRNRAWKALAAIPYGKTRTYGDLAHELTTSPRAVGNACRANELLIVIPCHRVVAKSGLGGFAGDASPGAALRRKAFLLELEAEGAKGERTEK